MNKRYIILFIFFCVFSTFAHFTINYDDHTFYQNQNYFFNMNWSYTIHSLLADHENEWHISKGVLNTKKRIEQLEQIDKILSFSFQVQIYDPTDQLCGTFFLRQNYLDKKTISLSYAPNLLPDYEAMCCIKHKIHIQGYLPQQTTLKSFNSSSNFDCVINLGSAFEYFQSTKNEETIHTLSLVLEKMHHDGNSSDDLASEKICLGKNSTDALALKEICDNAKRSHDLAALEPVYSNASSPQNRNSTNDSILEKMHHDGNSLDDLASEKICLGKNSTDDLISQEICDDTRSTRSSVFLKLFQKTCCCISCPK